MNQELPQPPPHAIISNQQPHKEQQGICSYLSASFKEIVVRDADEKDHYFPFEHGGIGMRKIGEDIRNLAFPVRVEVVEYPAGKGYNQIKSHRVTLLPPRRSIFFFDGQTIADKEGRDSLRKAGKAGAPDMLLAGIYDLHECTVGSIIKGKRFKGDFQPAQNPLEQGGA